MGNIIHWCSEDDLVLLTIYARAAGAPTAIVAESVAKDAKNQSYSMFNAMSFIDRKIKVLYK